MTTNVWDHLASAKHIDRIFLSCHTHSDNWQGSVDNHAQKVWEDVWEETDTIEYRHVRESFLQKIHRISIAKQHDEALRYLTYNPGKLAILCLIVYQECGYMLDSDPSELELLSSLGDRRAYMMLPACIALASIK